MKQKQTCGTKWNSATVEMAKKTNVKYFFFIDLKQNDIGNVFLTHTVHEIVVISVSIVYCLRFSCETVPSQGHLPHIVPVSRYVKGIIRNHSFAVSYTVSDQ